MIVEFTSNLRVGPICRYAHFLQRNYSAVGTWGPTIFMLTQGSGSLNVSIKVDGFVYNNMKIMSAYLLFIALNFGLIWGISTSENLART